MIRNLKAFGLVLVAAFAMSAVMASASSAAGIFTWGNTTQKITAVQDTGEGGKQIFTTTPGTVTCNEVTGSATIAKGTTESTEVLSSSITYNNSGSADTCPGPFGTQPKIEMNGCNYRFTAGQTIGTSGKETTGTAHIVCPAGQQIVINATGCTIKVPTQTPTGGHIIFKTIITTPQNHITIETTLSGITYSDSGLLCGTHADETNGTYTGNVTFVASDSTGAATKLEVE
jgi:uncharacterized protein affecting Mg2+/Co2+ transport